MPVSISEAHNSVSMHVLYTGIPCDVVDRAVPNQIAAYAKSLKEKYELLSVFPEKEWPPSVHIGHKYVSLALITHGRQLRSNEVMQEDVLRGKIDKVAGNKNETNNSDVFKPPEDAKKPLRVLIDGAPGIGKTTLCRKISKDWACGEFLGQYHLVVLLHLRERKVQKASRIEDLFYHDDPDLQAEVAKQVRKEQGENVLFIFDGWDELSLAERTEESLFLSIMEGQILRKSSVLVTSRPYSSDQLQCLSNLTRHAEVLGFREKEVHECIKSTITDQIQAKELIDSLQQRLDVTSLCYVPLNCAILLYVYQKTSCSLPDTLTELFDLFILHSLKRHAELTLKNQRLLRKLRTLKAIPSPLDSELDHICGLAFNGLKDDKLIFTEEEVESAFENPDVELEPKLLGLLTAFKSFSSHGEDITYQFLHLTIQEFLAARWVATHLSPQQQADFFVTHLADDRFRMTLLFLAGLSKLGDASFSRVFSKEIDFMEGDDWRDHRRQEQFFFLLAHFLYESKNPIHCKTLAHAIKQQSLFLFGYYTTFNFHILGYFLARSGCTWKRLQFTSNSTHHQLLQVLFTICEENASSADVKQLIISDESTADEPQTQINRPSASGLSISFNFEHGTTIVPCVFVVSISDLVRMVRIPAFLHLQTLELCGPGDLINGGRHDHHDIPDLQPLREFLRAGTIRNLTLLGVPGLNDTVIKECIAPELNNCTSLNSLDIGGSTITTDGLISLFEALKMNTALERLYVEMPRQGDMELLGEAVQGVLEGNTTLQVLSLINHFGYVLTSCPPLNPMMLHLRVLVALISNNQTLTTLTLVTDYNNLFIDRASGQLYLSVLETMLSHNQSLTSLNLVYRNSYLPAALYEAVARALTTNRTLQKLCIKGIPNIDTVERGLSMMFEALCNNSCLKMLVIDFKTLWPELFKFTHKLTITALTKLLKCNNSLKSLEISRCTFSQSQLQRIANALTLNPHRRDIDLTLGVPDQAQEMNRAFIQEEVSQFIAQRFYTVYRNYDIYSRSLTYDPQQEEEQKEKHQS